MDNESLGLPKISGIFWIILLFCAIFTLSLWLGHRLGNSTRHVALAAFPAARVQTFFSKEFNKRIDASILHQQNRLPGEIAPGEAAFSRQRNILLIGIDSFQAQQSRLEAVWMVIYLRDLPNIMLVPVYSRQIAGGDNPTTADHNLAELFKLEKGHTPGKKFIRALKAKQLWWDGYVIMDRSSLSKIIDLTSSETEGATQRLHLLTSNLPDPTTDPPPAMEGQAQLVLELCQNSAAALQSDKTNLNSLISQASAVIQTDLDLEEITRELTSALDQGGGITCEFPAMASAANLP